MKNLKRFFLISFVLVLSLASASYGGDGYRVVGDWETPGLDYWQVSWGNLVPSSSATCATLNNHGLNLVGDAGSYSWAIYLQLQDPNVDLMDWFMANCCYDKFEMDMTRFASEWIDDGDPGTNPYSALRVVINAGGSGGGGEGSNIWCDAGDCGGEWDPSHGDQTYHCVWDISSCKAQIKDVFNAGYNNDRYVEIYLIPENSGYLDPVSYCIDNARLVAIRIAADPSPADGASCVDPNVVLSWSPGVYADKHDVYFGTDYDIVNDANRTNPLGVLVSQNQDTNSYNPGGLEPCTTYYWRIDEVNAAIPPYICKGNIWSFTTWCEECNCIPPPEDMVAWWPLDETVGDTSEELVNNNDGTWMGSPTPLLGEYVANSLWLGQADYVSVPNSPELDFGTGDFSIDCWLKTSVTTGAKSFIDKRTGSIFTPTGYVLWLNAGKLAFIFGDGTEPPSCYGRYESSLFVADGSWHHVAVTVDRDDPSGLKLYVDCVSETFDPTGHQQSLTNDGDLEMGVDTYVPGNRFSGGIDEVEFFNRALSTNEICAIFEAGSAGKCKCPTKTYDDEADWNDPTAEFTGVRIDPNDPNGCLELLDPNDPCAATPYPYAWLANSGEGTVSKVNIYTGDEVARYRTGPPTASGNYSYLSPSRTTVDANGNCWVANRSTGDQYQGSVTKILLNPPAGKPTSKDTNHNGIIEAASNELLDWGDDYAVERHYLVGGHSVPRALAVDHDDYLWVGLYNERRCVKLDPDADVNDHGTSVTFSPKDFPQSPYAAHADRPAVLASVDLRNLDTSSNHDLEPYGMALSPNGRLYVSEHEVQGWVAEIDPVSAKVCQSHHVPDGSPYGITVDHNCIVWMADSVLAYPNQGRCIRWDPKGGAGGFSFGTGAAGRGRGITPHPNGGIWMACDLVLPYPYPHANKVAKFDGSLLEPVATNYPSVGKLQMADLPVGIGVGADGSIITVGQSNNTWSKISAGPTPPEGTEIIINPQKQKTGPAPYTYSDFTGSIANQSRQQGFWTVIFDSGVPGQKWGKVTWISDEPDGTSVEVWIRAANAPGDLDNRDYIEVFSGVDFGGVSGRYIQVRVRLSRKRPSAGDCNSPPSCEYFPVSPKLCELTVDANCSPCRIICPNDIFVQCESPEDGGAWVDLPATQISGDCNSIEPFCDCESPHFFEEGTHKVTCTAYDMQGNTVECYYFVTVVCPNDITGACCYYMNGEMWCMEGVSEKLCNERYNGFYRGNDSTCAGDINDICPVCIPVPYNAVAWWPFDEESGPSAIDLAQLNNEGTYMGDPTPTGIDNGFVEGALIFDGDGDYVEVEDHFEINFGTGDLSIDAWVKTSNDWSPFGPVADKRTPPSGYALFLYYGYLAFALADPGSAGFAEFISVGPESFVADDVWHNVAVTFDRDDPEGLNLYVDGDAVGTFNGMGKSGDLDNDANLLIGKGYGISGPVSYFEGILDEVEMFDRALSGPEIQQLAAAEDDGKCKEYAHVTKFLSCCPPPYGPAGIMVLTICNFTEYNSTYIYKVEDVAGPGCTYVGLNASGEVEVSARQCKNIEIPFECPSGMWYSPDITACSEVTVRNKYSGRIIASISKLRATRWCAEPFFDPNVLPFPGDPNRPIPFIKFIDGNSPSIKVPFNMTNMDDPCEVFNYRIEARDPDGSLTELIILNESPPGTPVEGSVPLAIGETVQLSVDVRFADHEGSVFFDIVLLADVDGYGTYEELVSRSVRSVLCGETIDDSRRKGDLNLDCCVQMTDYAMIASVWLSELGDPEYNPDFDIAADNVIDFYDLEVLVDNWLEEALWP